MIERVNDTRTIGGREVRYSQLKEQDSVSGTVLYVYAHWDDDAMSAGLDVALANRNFRVVHIGLTASNRRPFGDLSPEEIAEMRWREVHASGNKKKVDRLYGVPFPDGKLASYEAEATVLVKEVIEEENPLLIFTPNPQDEHSDHRAAHRATISASNVPVYATDTINGFDRRGNPVMRTHHIPIKGSDIAASIIGYRLNRSQHQIPVKELSPVYDVFDMPLRHAAELAELYNVDSYYASAVVFDATKYKHDPLRESFGRDIFVRQFE